jgi:hypothetical protein
LALKTHGVDPEETVNEAGRAAPRQAAETGIESFDAGAAEVVRGISDFTKWSSMWRKMAATDERANTSFEEGALIIGVFSIDSATAHQKVIRDTWMNQGGVCNLLGEEVPRAGCSIYVAFVMGRRSDSSGTPLRDGLYLDIEENMNLGKTFAFFRFAARQFPWAMHIAKMDMDAFPHLHKVMVNLYGSEKPCWAKYEYWGTKFGRKNCEWAAWGRSFTDKCPDDSCVKKLPCADQMNGGMYGLSRDLALEATEPGTIWAKYPVGGEDATTGYRLHQWAHDRGKCVSMWMMADGYFHMTGGSGSVEKPTYGGQSVNEFYRDTFVRK